MKYSILALTFASVSQAHKLSAYSQHKHAVDFLDESGESVTFESMLANQNSKPIELSNVQIKSEDEGDAQAADASATDAGAAEAAAAPEAQAAAVVAAPAQIDDSTPEGARLKFAQMQAQMEANVQAADARKAQQDAQTQNLGDDPAGQLQGLMNAQQSLKRIGQAFSTKPNVEKVQQMAQKLGIPMTPDIMQLGNNEAISNALVEIAVGMGKSEEEISAALGAE